MLVHSAVCFFPGCSKHASVKEDSADSTFVLLHKVLKWICDPHKAASRVFYRPPNVKVVQLFDEALGKPVQLVCEVPCDPLKKLESPCDAKLVKDQLCHKKLRQ